VLVDPQQLENVILNLALNASDAMPSGGTFTIRVDNVRKDDAGFVHLAFADTGCGMPDDVKARAFEPFFSTKGIGKGTGLGLSMAYGFVKQSGGHIDIDSTVGEGTTINILLPRTDGTVTEKKTMPLDTVARGTETVLAVDDEQDILDNVAAMLRDLGYRVLTADSAGAALAMLDGQERIDLLFTDVIMPGAVSATELAECACRAHPGIRVLFTSGYTDNAVIHNGRLDEGVKLLSKPYGRAELASAVRAVLEARSAASTAEVA
jgi:CheY-like chemotaxis protein